MKLIELYSEPPVKLIAMNHSTEPKSLVDLKINNTVLFLKRGEKLF